MTLHALLWKLLSLGVLPAWLLAGAADWLCHRRTHIECNSGARESRMHLLLHAQIALPVLLGLWFEINAGMLAFMALCVAAHMFTSLADTRLAQPLRHISPIEQQVHGWLEMLPLFALACVAMLHADALRDPQWLPSLRTRPAPTHWLVIVPLGFAGGFALIIEEYLRGRARQRQGAI
jgi:hypothetical protein